MIVKEHVSVPSDNSQLHSLLPKKMLGGAKNRQVTAWAIQVWVLSKARVPWSLPKPFLVLSSGFIEWVGQMELFLSKASDWSLQISADLFFFFFNCFSSWCQDSTGIFTV